MALADRFRSMFGARAAALALEAEGAPDLVASPRPQELGDAMRAGAVALQDAAHRQEHKSVASGAEMVVTHRLPVGSSGTNHIVFDEAHLVDGACTVELGPLSAFTTARHYKVFVTPQSGSATCHVVQESGSSFTIRSSDDADTAVVSFLAIGD